MEELSHFKKPRRNLRGRVTLTDPDDDENEPEERGHIYGGQPVDSGNSKKKTSSSFSGKGSSKKTPKTQSLLSFEEDLNEGDDGEVFKVKKSAQSKKFRKQLDKEKKKKKDKPEEPSENETPSGNKSKNNLDEGVMIKLKNTFPILNGREAEAATQEGISSEEDGDESVGDGPVHRFSKRDDPMRLIFERGKIPDAAMIHAARKRRQQAREMGEIVPVPDDSERFENSKSRLVREDENDASDGDDEERIKMTVHTAAQDRIRRKAEFEAAQQDAVSEESDKGEEEEWENQQIRKGVTGAQIAAVQQETMYYQQLQGAFATGIGMGGVPIDVESTQAGPVSGVFPQLPPAPCDPRTVISKLKERLREVKEVHRRHCLDRDAALEERDTLTREIRHLQESAPRLADRYTFYQDLRGYVTDLVDCLDEKVLAINSIEQRVDSMLGQRVGESMARRRQDVLDQAQELLSSSQKVKVERDEATMRRIAEREGRRIRRQRMREIKGMTSHIEGMSSDEETTEIDQVHARSQREIIEKDAVNIFEDVLDEFCTVSGVLDRFENWRKFDRDAYTEAYVSLCLPKLLSPLIRLESLLWNPLAASGSDMEQMDWYQAVVVYGLEPSETEESLRKDPDIQFLPRVVEKIIIPKLTQLVTHCWDPVSTSQTVSLVGLVTKIIQDYPTATASATKPSKNIEDLLKAVVDRMKDSVEHDVYIPLFPKQRLNEGKAMSFFMRQCAVAVKLLGNICRWQGLIADSVLSDIALDSLLNRYVLMAVRMSGSLQSAHICQMVGAVLPRIWLQVCVHPPQLTSFLNESRNVAKQLDCDKPAERDALERLGSVLKAASSSV